MKTYIVRDYIKGSTERNNMLNKCRDVGVYPKHTYMVICGNKKKVLYLTEKQIEKLRVLKEKFNPKSEARIILDTFLGLIDDEKEQLTITNS